MCLSSCFSFTGVCGTILLKLMIWLEDMQKVTVCSLLQRCRPRPCEVMTKHGIISLEIKSVSQNLWPVQYLKWMFSWGSRLARAEQQTGAQVLTLSCNGYLRVSVSQCMIWRMRWTSSLWGMSDEGWCRACISTALACVSSSGYFSPY